MVPHHGYLLFVRRPDLAEELTLMAEEDLAVRQRLLDSGELHGGYNETMRAVHRHNGDRLAAILDDLACWPGYELVGAEGSGSAFLIAQHDIANPDLLRRSADLYAAAVANADAEPAKLAQLEDRIRYLEGRPQRYGTHWGWDEDGEFGPWPPVEDPELVNERRAQLGLAPLAEARALALADSPEQRSADAVRTEHRQAEEFARSVGWRR